MNGGSVPLRGSPKVVRPGFPRKPVFPGRQQGPNECHYCHSEGHWKAQCPLLQSKGRHNAAVHVPAMFCAAPENTVCVTPNECRADGLGKTPVCASGENAGFEPFITDAVIALVGSDARVPIKVLRDTGANQSFVLDTVLPFSSKSETGDSILMKGMELGLITVPRHIVEIDCKLVQGVVPVGIRPELPLKGVSMVLGNDLAGSRVWAEVPPPPVVVSKPVVEDEDMPAVFPACVVTRAQKKKSLEQSRSGASEGDVVDSHVVLPYLPSTVARKDWVASQKADSSLSLLWAEAHSVDKIRDLAQGYFVQEGLLVRKWVPCDGDFVGEAVFQVVVPCDFRDEVLKTAHNDCGHLGVKKTYDRVLRYFFWPRLKRDVSKYVKSCHICQLVG